MDKVLEFEFRINRVQVIFFIILDAQYINKVKTVVNLVKITEDKIMFRVTGVKG